MIIDKPCKLYVFYGSFMALCYVFISMPVSTFEVCWKTPSAQTLHFSGTFRLIRGVSQVSGFCMVWIFTFENSRVDYCVWFFFNINKLSLYVIFIILCNIGKGSSTIGSFLYKTSSRDIPSHNIMAFLHVYFNLLSSMCKSLILLGGDIETNPDPVSSSEQYFSVCHWNLNSIAAHKYAKLSLFTAYNLLHSFDIICL